MQKTQQYANKTNNRLLFLILAAGLAMRMIIALAVNSGHPTDIRCFVYWAEMLHRDGFASFYASDVFTDYPPGYMYVLYVLGWLRNLFGLAVDSRINLLIIKMPAIIADLCAGALVWYIAGKHTDGKKTLTATCAYVFNPLVILISAVWGQVDAVHTVLLAVSLYLAVEKKTGPSFLLFAVCAMIKPQSFMFTPIYLYAAYKHLSDGRFSLKAFLTLGGYIGASLAAGFLMLLPFLTFPLYSVTDGGVVFTPVIQQYLDTLASYPYCTVNAYNTYGLFGLNWTPAANTFIIFSYEKWGYTALVAIVAVSFVMLSKSKSKWNYFYTAAFINFSTFMFSVKMHERYIFPALLFLLIAYVMTNHGNIVYVFAAVSAAAFLNCWDVLRMSLNDFDYSMIDSSSRIFSGVTVIVYAFFLFATLSVYRQRHKDQIASPAQQVLTEDSPFEPQKTEPNRRYTRTDFIFLAALMLSYGFIAFYKLGDMSAPVNAWQPAYSETAEVLFDSPREVSQIQFFNGERPDRSFAVRLAQGQGGAEYTASLTSGAVFRWSGYGVPEGVEYTGAQITVFSADMSMLEMAFRDADGELIPVTLVSGTGGELFDEQSLVPERSDYMNSTYFDEIYHPRTAYEYIHGLEVYETTHPPLGKVIIAAGIKIFGMTPWGWRFMGALFGVLMLPFIYDFARRLTKSSYYAFFGTFIFAFDFMHYAQTRLATIDTYIVFFVIGMYYFMYRYCTMSFYGEKLCKTLIPLGLSGAFMGLGIASKWPGVYAGAGLAVLFFMTLYRRYAEHEWAEQNKAPGYDGFAKKTLITLSCCVAFFVVIPALIYLASYIPYYYNCGLYPDKSFVSAVIQSQRDMFNYHNYLNATHDFSSEWWSWPFNLRPIWYYTGDIAPGIKQGISSFGNPAVWLTGLAAAIVCAADAFIRKNRVSMFLVIGYLAQYLPWALVDRCTFIYHYFPCVPFIVLMLSHVFNKFDGLRLFDLGRFRVTGRVLSYGFLAVVMVLFIMFYPVLSGAPVSVDYVRKVLQIIPSWYLI